MKKILEKQFYTVHRSTSFVLIFLGWSLWQRFQDLGYRAVWSLRVWNSSSQIAERVRNSWCDYSFYRVSKWFYQNKHVFQTLHVWILHCQSDCVWPGRNVRPWIFAGNLLFILVLISKNELDVFIYFYLSWKL